MSKKPKKPEITDFELVEDETDDQWYLLVPVAGGEEPRGHTVPRVETDVRNALQGAVHAKGRPNGPR